MRGGRGRGEGGGGERCKPGTNRRLVKPSGMWTDAYLVNES